jgi:hypothetical protein
MADKGVEFGVKAAGEVSKDVWKQVGKDAGSAAFGHFRPGGSVRRKRQSAVASSRSTVRRNKAMWRQTENMWAL